MTQPTPTEMWKIATDLRERFEAVKISIRIDFEDSSVTYEVPASQGEEDELCSPSASFPFSPRSTTRSSSPACLPPNQDLCDELGLASVGNVNRHINGLVERGFLRRTPRKARAIEVVKLPASMGGVCT